MRARLTRRSFLLYSSAVVASGILAACSNNDKSKTSEQDTAVSGKATPTLVSETSPPQPTSAGTPVASPPATPQADTGTPGAADADVAKFLVLSSALTGFDGLNNADLASVYMNHLGDDADHLDDLYDKVGITSPDATATFDDIQNAGVFDDKDLQPVADRIMTYWYSGKYQAGDKPDDLAVGTFVNALAWQATGYRITGPSTCTGATGVWSTPPAA
jgi:hypothetical protein